MTVAGRITTAPSCEIKVETNGSRCRAAMDKCETPEERSWPSGWWLVPAFIFGAFIWGAILAAVVF